MPRPDRIFLDHAATTPLHPRARAAMIDALGPAGRLGNPSSIHREGQRARALLDDARERLAAGLGVRAGDVIFTSGATEANALALLGAAATRTEPGRLLHSAIEHPSVLATTAQLARRGWRVQALPVRPDGQLDVARAEASFAFGPPLALVSVMAVNNETGVVLPVPRLAAAARDRGALVHCDATQLVGREPVAALTLDALDADLVTISAHKFGGPAGVGALLVRPGVSLCALQGGHQEEGLRAGTENLLGILGAAAAAEALPDRRAQSPAVRTRRETLWRGLAGLPGAIRAVAGGQRADSGHVLSVAFAGLDAVDVVMAMDLEGVAVSAGAACASGTTEPSHVFAAMWPEGPPDGPAGLQRSVVRISLGPETTDDMVQGAIERFTTALGRLRGAAAPRP